MIKAELIELPNYTIVAPDYTKPWSDDEVASGISKCWNDEWEIQNLGWDMNPGILPSYEGRKNVFASHPLNQNTPFAFVRTVTLPENKTAILKLGVTSFNGSAHPSHFEADWLLRIYVDDKLIFNKLIEREAGKIKWYDLEVSLAEYAGKTINLRVENAPNNWSFEAAYWDYLDLEIN